MKLLKTIFYEHKVHYYETDKMNCVHHSNYIRWFEEARTYLMDKFGFGYFSMEEHGVMSPVLKVEADYKIMTRFGESVLIETSVSQYTGVRVTFCYQVREKESGELKCSGKTYHCFISAESGRPVSMKKALPELHEIIQANI